MFINGQLDSTVTDNDTLAGYGSFLYVGASYQNTENLIGKMQNLKISRFPRWVDNFTPPMKLAA